MRCPTCGGENVDGAKFCGVCGARMVATTVPPVADVAPRVTAETRQVPQQRVAPPPAGMSLGESMRVPEAKGARMAKIVFVLAIDAALAAAGVVLMTRGGGDADAAVDGAAGAGGATAGGGSASAVGSGAATASGEAGGGGGGGATGGGGAVTGGGTTGGGTTGGGGGTTGGGGRPPGSGTGTGTGTGTGVGTGTGMGTGTGSDDDPIGAAAAAAAAAAAGKIDAGAGSSTTMPAVDAGVPVIDAAPEVVVDAAEAVLDAPEAAASAGELASHLARLVVQSGGKMDRCYQNATKALPEDQPLAGEVDIGLAVMPTGAVQNVRVTRNTTGSNDLASCVQATAAQWAFPAHGEGEPVEFVHVFRFGPRNN